jgi:carboxylesterase type B
MIYIYGGGFFAGTAQPYVDGPDYFMETKEVVMVFMAYRVAALGFLSTGDQEAPGNIGLKDQALAIKWTVKNIKYFGGDSKKITLLGMGVRKL